MREGRKVAWYVIAKLVSQENARGRRGRREVVVDKGNTVETLVKTEMLEEWPGKVVPLDGSEEGTWKIDKGEKRKGVAL